MDVEGTIAALDRGEVRVAEKVDGDWRVNEEAKAAILEYFRMRKVEPIEVGPFEYLDKIPLKHDHAERGVRVVPPATARYGSFLSPGVILMPSYVNIGAWVGPNISPGETMIPRSSSAAGSGPTTQRYIVASLATISQPWPSIAGISASRLAR